MPFLFKAFLIEYRNYLNCIIYFVFYLRFENSFLKFTILLHMIGQLLSIYEINVQNLHFVLILSLQRMSKIPLKYQAWLIGA